eukprot:scaffold184856_cov30-Tisochrysis_lutea.AAC.2
MGAGGNVRDRIRQCRDITQGHMTLDELHELEDRYEQSNLDDFGFTTNAPRDHSIATGAADDEDGDWFMGSGSAPTCSSTAASAAAAAVREAARAAATQAAPVSVTAEQAERMERNRQLALQRAAARGATGSATQGANSYASGGMSAADLLDPDGYPDDTDVVAGGFPEEDDDNGGYPDDDDEINDDDEAMAEKMLGDIEDDLDEDNAVHTVPPTRTVLHSCTGASLRNGSRDETGTRAVPAALATVTDTEPNSAVGESQLEITAAEGDGPATVLDETLADTLATEAESGAFDDEDRAAQERRARALADAMAMDEDF